MHFTGFVLKTHLYIGSTPDVKEVMLYNGRKIHIRGPSYAHPSTIKPGDIIVFACGYNDLDLVELDRPQQPKTFYRVSWDWAVRVTDEDTIRSFLMSARILGGSDIGKNRHKRIRPAAKIQNMSCKPLRKAA
jgi:hypothetical protein